MKRRYDLQQRSAIVTRRPTRLGRARPPQKRAEMGRRPRCIAPRAPPRRLGMVDATTPPRMHPPALRGDSQPPPQPPLVMVVEDDLDMRELVSEALLVEGYAVCSEARASEAFARVLEGEEGIAPRVDVVVTDLRLDHASGMELLTALQGIPAKPPVVLMTGFISREQRDMARLFGVEVLDKPFALDALRDAVKKLLVVKQ
jgi:CheY-like chemotaxis protein